MIGVFKFDTIVSLQYYFVYEKTVISEYVRATDDDVKANLGKLEKGTYKVIVTAYSPYTKKGETISTRITVN